MAQGSAKNSASRPCHDDVTCARDAVSLFWVAVAFALIEYRDAMIAGGQPAPYRTYRRHGRHIMEVFPKGYV